MKYYKPRRQFWLGCCVKIMACSWIRRAMRRCHVNSKVSTSTDTTMKSLDRKPGEPWSGATFDTSSCCRPDSPHPCLRSYRKHNVTQLHSYPGDTSTFRIPIHNSPQDISSGVADNCSNKTSNVAAAFLLPFPAGWISTYSCIFENVRRPNLRSHWVSPIISHART